MTREGIVVERPYERLSKQQIEQIHNASIQILRDPGMISWNREAAKIFHSNGAEVTPVSSNEHPSWLVKIPEALILQAINDAPKVVKLGARNRDNTLILNGEQPKVYFMGPAGESSTILDVDFETYIKKSEPSVEIQRPVFRLRTGPVLDDLCKITHLCEHLESLDIFQNCFRITDEGITEDNRVVNTMFACLNNTTKHVRTSLIRLNVDQLDQVIKTAEIIAGGAEELKDNPIISFSCGPIVSPLQFDVDATQELIAAARRGLIFWAGVNPLAGLTAPILESGMLAQANAEALAVVALTQLVNKGTPIIYTGALEIPRMDTFSASYSSPETIQYGIDFTQMARFYKLPCYIIAGTADAKVPGIEASVEKMTSHLGITLAGAQVEWCCFGRVVVEGKPVVCLPQVVLDDAHIRIIKHFLKAPRIGERGISESLNQIREVMGSPQKQFIRYIRPFLRTEQITPLYPFESDSMEDEALHKAYNRMQQLLSKPVEHISEETTKRIFSEIPGILPKLNIYTRRNSNE